VWRALIKMEDFKDFMPKVVTSEVLRREKNEMDVRFVLDVPGPDTDYTIRYTKDEAKKTLTGTWAAGDLKGSRWFWKIEPAEGGKTLLSQQVSVKNFSSILASVEDDQQTMTVGVNVSSALAAGKALKKKCEQADVVADAGAKEQ
jgi:ribosome-associated toxin RatA of RatAB toxin-antitoxin module